MGRSVMLWWTPGVAEESPGGLDRLMPRVGGMDGGREEEEGESLKGESLVSIFQKRVPPLIGFN